MTGAPPSRRAFSAPAGALPAHRFGSYALAPPSSPQAPVQPKRSATEWIKHKLGIGYDWEREWEDRSEVGERSNLIHRGGRGVGIDLQPNIDAEDMQSSGASARKAILDARSTATGIASAGKVGVATASAFKDATGAAGPILSTVAGPIGVAGSLATAGLKTKQIATGADKKKDKALLGLGAASDLATATASGASTVHGIAGLTSGGLSSALSAGSVAVAGPAALAMGGADVVSGGVGAGLAEYRRRRLAAMETEHQGSDESAVLRMAKEAQKTKRNSNLGTVLKGGLGLAAGGTLLAGALGATAATPVGWGLLAGAGLVGLGVLGYRQWRKHRQGTRLMKDPEERAKLARLGVATPGKRELEAESRWRRWNPFNTKESRAYDLVRSSTARMLDHELDNAPVNFDSEENSPLTAMVSHLGLKSTGPKRARKKDLARALEG